MPPGMNSNDDFRSQDSEEILQEFPEFIKARNYQDSVELNNDSFGNIWPKIKEELYPQWFLDHLDWPSFKIVLRTWLQYWVCMLLTLISRTSQWLGPTGYLINIGASIETSGSISIATSVLIGVSAVSFMFYGVLCATVANAITWHMRGYPTKQDIMQDLANQSLCEIGDERCLIEQLQTGRYLTTKCSVIHLFAMIWALTSIGWLSTRYKIFSLSWLFFSIPLSLSSVTTVVIPYFDPWYFARQVVVPITINSCARVFFSIFIFPTTSNARYCGKLIETCHRIDQVMYTLTQYDEHKPSDAGFIDTHHSTKRELHSLYKMKAQVQSDRLMSKFEFSYGRFLPHHLVYLQGFSLEVGSAISDHLFFFTEIQKHVVSLRANLTPTDSQTHKLRRYLSPQESSQYKFHQYKPIGKFEREMKEQYTHTTADHMPMLTLKDLDELVNVVTKHFSELANSTYRLQLIITKWLKEANKWRTYTLLSSQKWDKCRRNQLSCAQELVESIQALEDILHSRCSRCEVTNLSAFLKRPIFVRELAAYYGFASKTIANKVLLLAKYLVKIDTARPVPSFITPWRTWAANQSWAKLLHGFGGIDSFNGDENLDIEADYEVYQPLERVQARDPESTPPRNKCHLMGRYLVQIWDILTDDLLQFALKRALFTAAAYIPIYCRPTTKLFFSKRLGWVSAMVALTVSRQAVEGIYGFVNRLLFTLYGCILAAVGWYISRGNVYGYAAVMAVLFAYVSYHRHFCNHLNAVSPIILSLSIVIVSGGSYAIAHHEPVGLHLKPGIEVAWVRAVCVIVGLTIALVGTFFPHPYTGKRAIRNLEGVIISRITEIFTAVNNFSMERYDKPDVRVQALKDGIEEKVIGSFALSQSADTLMSFLRFEPPLTGAWPKNRYRILTNTQQESVQILWMMYLMFDEVEDVKEAIPRLLWKLGWTNPAITHSLYSLLYMSSHAIVSGEPLPAVSPSYLGEMHADHFQDMKEAADDNNNVDSGLEDVASILARLLYERLDGIMLTVKGLVGEAYDSDTRVYGFDEKFRDDPSISYYPSAG